MAFDQASLSALYAAAGSPEALLNAVFAFLGAETEFYKDPLEANALLHTAYEANRPPLAAPQPNDSTPDLLRPMLEQPKALIQENGFDYGRYSWTQTLNTVEIIIPLQLCTRTSALRVELTPERLTIQTREPIRDLLPPDRLFSPILVKESLWSLIDGQRLELTLYKAKSNEWWIKLFETDKHEVDAKTITPETISSLAELDHDTRATVEKMMQEQRLKNLIDAR